MSVTQSSVLIVGAGPVGLTLAMDLAWRGIDVVIVERRAAGEPPSVKCNHVAARSMEIFRRLGVADALRGAGLPADYPHDVVYRTSATGQELTRIVIPSPVGRKAGERGPDTDWPTAEPPHRINQIFLEPILYAHAAAMPQIRIVNQADVESFEQDDAGVTVRARSLAGGEPLAFFARFLIGCDGGRSLVRRQIGAGMIGDAVVQRVQSTYLRAPDLLHRMTRPLAWGNFSLNPRRCGNVYAIDGRETWLVHNYLNDDEADFDAVDRDWAIRTILGVGSDFSYEILSKEDWFGRRLIADRFRDRRVFLCGDSAHIWVPFAGYGMNAGIADAANLAWLLAAHLKGWGDAAVLDAYEAERLPITEQVSHFAMNHALAVAKHRREVPSDIEDAGAEALRRSIGARVYELNVQQYCCAGLNFGYYYDRSPLIAYDGEPQPAYGMGTFTPSTVPGCRLPHFFLPSGRSLYDALDQDYTLLRSDRAIDVAPLRRAAAALGFPLALLDMDPPEDMRGVFGHALYLVRPDQHIAWRGDKPPADAAVLIRRVSGRAVPPGVLAAE
ncbi:FAD-dependent oxidoreductase [Bradyrhizobium sp. NP1]|uniref:FAD-dependent oxidoreductase n=1 Tax=Bradyrhizobium sp. NP1 TaxID=3049772 RepID=UPI0025A5F627|nr:FAD-dependent oxidoreductase [Bradyrhizobium sp. NP1]WJR79936.1 FAD-dependent oxidoreductase [Bradyrhizobium sp. NP1]